MILNKNEIVLQIFFMHKLKEKADKLYHHLSPTECERVSQYNTAEKKDRFILSRGILKEVLSKHLEIDPKNIEIHYSKFNKPYLSQGLQFNISHSQDLLIIGLSLDYLLGVDIEFCRPKNSIPTLVQKFYSYDECEYFFSLSLSQRDQSFYSLWTLKEAYQKANGNHFSLDALKETVLQGMSSGGMFKNDWKLQLIPFDRKFENYVGAFCFKKVISSEDSLVTNPWRLILNEGN